MAKMVCFGSKAKAKSVAKHRRAAGKKAHMKKKGKGKFCVVAGKARKSRRRSRRSKK